jgi:hypothetical protein
VGGAAQHETGAPVLEARLSDQSSQRLARGRNRSRPCYNGTRKGDYQGMTERL